jgi:secreted trypsin-like serine protease
MRQAIMVAAMLAAAGAGAQTGPGPQPDVIYGSDDRLDLWQVQNKRLLALADSTVALFEASDVTLSKDQATLATQHYGRAYNLCKEEPFYDQENGAFCSGSLIGPDLLMTAGHCVTSAEACQGTRFVFGFGLKSKGASPKTVPAADVYSCGELLGREQNNGGADWALIRLDRPAAGRVPLKLSPGGVGNV